MGEVISFVGSGIFGSLMGGVFRLIPEFFKFLDRRDERKHELAMFDRQCDLEKVRGQIKLDEINAQRDAAVDTGMVSAFKAAIDQQAEMVKAAGGKIAALSASVRPVMTYYMLGVYGCVKIAIFVLSLINKDPAVQVLAKVWTPEDMALLCGVVNYWLLDRSLAKRGLA